VPFAGYGGMEECVEDNSDKDDPGAYCAQIHKNATGEWPSEKSGLAAAADRAVEALGSLLPGGGDAGGGGASGAGGPAVKVYVPDAGDVPAGPEAQRDEGGWFYTMTPAEMERLPAPDAYVAVVGAGETLYPDRADEKASLHYIEDRSEAPSHAEVEEDAQGRLYWYGDEDPNDDGDGADGDSSDTATDSASGGDSNNGSGGDSGRFDGTPTGDDLREELSGMGRAPFERAEATKDAVRAGLDPLEAADILRNNHDNWRALSAVRPSVTDDFGPTDDDGNRLVVRDPSWHDVRELREEMHESLTDDAKDTYEDVRNGWAQSMYNDERAKPMIAGAISNTGNDNVPEWADQDFDPDDVSEESVEEFEQLREFTAEKFREAYGDEVRVFRGLTDSPHQGTPDEGTGVADKLREAADGGEPTEMEHRPVESWSINPATAGTYAAVEDDDQERGQVGDGVIVSTTVSPEQVLMSSQTGAMEPRENEVVIEHDGPAEYSKDEVFTELAGGAGGVEVWLQALAAQEGNDNGQ